MCGIAGRVNQHAPVDREELFRMTERIAHRGPDDSGYHLRAHVGLGHRRLAIVDLAGGRQPLSNEDDSVVIVYNGEVYNHLDLRRELLARGHRFKTRSDTEAIVHAYEEWGADCATRLRGMFAFAIWDDRTQSLTLVRDRLGIKPVYYAQLGGDLVFASELKSLLVVPSLELALDEEALSAYLTLRYVPGPLTLFRSIKKLPPGHVLRWHRGLVSIRPYWDLAAVAPRDEVPPTEVEAAFELRERIDHVTALRLMSEVPVGAFLSGGVDSTVITEAMLRAAARRGPLKTFAVGYAGEGTEGEDELAHARAAAHALGAEHREVRVTMAEARDALPKIAWHLDEPLADPACVPLYFLARRAREEVTVVLSGEGADELLGGYTIYQRMLQVERARAAGGPLTRVAAQLLGLVPAPRARRLARLLDQPLERAYRGVSRAFDDPARLRLCRASSVIAGAEALLAHAWRRSRGLTPLRRMLYLDTKVWLPDDLLIKADKMTMAHAVELRVPFLDHHLVEWAFSLPDRYKVRGGAGKWLLRRAVRDRVPRFVLERPKKGFGTPTAAWLRTGLHDLLRASLFGARSFARDRFDLRFVEALVSRHRAGEDLAAELWPLLSLELWWSALVQPAHARRLEPIKESIYAAS